MCFPRRRAPAGRRVTTSHLSDYLAGADSTSERHGTIRHRNPDRCETAITSFFHPLVIRSSSQPLRPASRAGSDAECTAPVARVLQMPVSKPSRAYEENLSLLPCLSGAGNPSSSRYMTDLGGLSRSETAVLCPAPTSRTNCLRVHPSACIRGDAAADPKQSKSTSGGGSVGATIRPLPGVGDLSTYRVEPDFGSGSPAAPRDPAGAAPR